MSELFFVVTFLIVCFLQSLVINGVKMATEEGEILEGYGKWLKKTLGSYWCKPFGLCVKCSASVIGGLMFWPLVLWQYGFEIWQLPLYIANTFIVSAMSWWIYKKI